MFRFKPKAKLKLKPKVLPHRTSIAHCFQAINIISNIFGISYFNQINSKFHQIINKSYTLVVYVLFLGIFLYRISSISPQFCQPDTVSSSVMGIQEILGAFVLTTIYYQVLFYRNRFQNMFKMLSTVDTEFTGLNLKFTYENSKRKMIIELVVLMGFTFTSFVFFKFFYKVQSTWFLFLELFSSINPMLVIIVNLMAFSNMVWFTRNRFRMLKNILIGSCAIDTSIANKSNKVWNVQMTRETPTGLHRNMKKIGKIYEKLFCMVNDLNDIFGLSNLTSMGEFMHAINYLQLPTDLKKNSLQLYLVFH